MEGKFFQNKKGQVTLFIIIAIVIVGLGVLIYTFYPRLQTSIGLETESPTEFIQICLEEQINTNLAKISSQGGSISPENYFIYDNEKLEYLCYTNKYYETCIMQKPFLKEHIESELENSIKDSANDCFNALKESFENKGYEVSLQLGNAEVELFPQRIITKFGHKLTLTKGETQRYEEFSIIVNNNLYELINIAMSILEYETTYGDSETILYMNFYHNLKVEKKKQSEGTTIYILTNRDTGDKFQFASRSVVWPSGY